MDSWLSYIASFFLFVTNARGDVWSRTAVYWKDQGLTPLEAVHAFRKAGVYVYGKKMSIPEFVPIAYAGRLDPMAEGKLLLLIGDECKKITAYRERDKTYVVEVLLGVSTDTGDLLGVVGEVALQKASSPFSQDLSTKLRTVIKKFIGTHEWEYPIFSSKTVQGKPLFRWFYEGKIGDIKIPKRTMVIHALSYKGCRDITGVELMGEVKRRIGNVTKVLEHDKEWGNDFRREDVLQVWDARLHKAGVVCTIVTIECRCGSGTYMRTLAEKIGTEVGVPACAFSITRTSI